MANRIHGLLGAAAAVVVAVGFLGWRSLHPSTRGVLATPAPSVPNAGVAGLAQFAEPLPDSMRTVKIARDSLVLRRDPLAGQAAPQVASGPAEHSDTTPARTAADVWHVTTTLLSGNRRAALINDELIYVGDPLPDGSKLTRVERDHVVVTDPRGAAHTVAVAKEGNG